MRENEKNYDDIKLVLYRDIKEEAVNTVVEHLQTSLSLSASTIHEVLDLMVEAKDILIIEDKLYVLDNIHFRMDKLRVIRGKFAFVGEGSDAVYVAAEDFKDALDQDLVLVRIRHGQKIYGTIEHIVKRKREYLLGTLKLVKKRFVFEAYDRKIPNTIEFTPNNIQPIVDQRIIAKIIEVKKGIIYVSLESVLGMKDAPGVDVLSVLFEHDLETEFNESVLEEAKAVEHEVKKEDLNGRIDHRNQYAITIDGEDAKDLDDAIFLEPLSQGYRLYVHIADVSHYVKEDSAIDQSAYARTSSIYMVDRVVPMLPQVLSNGICSLTPHEDRLCLTCKMDIDFEGEIYNYEIYPSVIQSKRRMSYAEINDGDDFGEVTEMIKMMLHCADILQSKRGVEGSIDFETSESVFLVDSDDTILDITARESGKAEKMIENFMVSANESVAKYAHYQELPVLYRVHEKPDQDKMKDLAHTLLILGYRMRGNLSEVHPRELQKVLKYFDKREEQLVVSKLMLRSMKKARYAAQPLGHFGLALTDYSHFTAPIRRYSDLLTHRNLRKYVFEHNFDDFKEDHLLVEDAANHISEKERVILDAEREVEKMKKAEYMLSKINEKYDGIISGVSNFGIFVELANTVEGVIPLNTLKDDFYTLDVKTHRLVGERSKQVYSLGQAVKIKVESVDTLDHEVIFSLRESKSSKGGRRRVKKHRQK